METSNSLTNPSSIVNILTLRYDPSIDPNFSSSEVFGIKVDDNLDDILTKMDAAVIVTGHDDFKKIEISSFAKMKTPILIDTRGIIEPQSVKHHNIIFRGLGRGDF